MRAPLAAIVLALVALVNSDARGSVFLDSGDNAISPDGFYMLVYADYFSSNDLRGPGLLGRPGSQKTDANYSYFLTYLRPLAYFHLGAQAAAFHAFIPIGFAAEKLRFDESSSSLGDIVFGPGLFLYSDQKSATHVSYWFYLYAPTGDWDRSRSFVNLGLHHWYFMHQLAFNKTAGDLTLDVNLNLYHHIEEPVFRLQTPPRFETAVCLLGRLTKTLSAGLHGGGYWDLRDYWQAGFQVADSKGEKISVGPAFNYQPTNKLLLTFRWTRDVTVVNDFKGDETWLRAYYTF